MALEHISTATLAGAPEIVGDMAYAQFFREEVESSQQPEYLPFPVLTAQQVAALLDPLCEQGAAGMVALAERQKERCGGDLLPILKGCPTVGPLLPRYSDSCLFMRRRSIGSLAVRVTP